MKEQLGKAESAATVPILCRFWFEDGVWNGVAEDLAVAAFGGSFEEAMANLRMAIESHLESVLEAGEVGDVVKHLEQRAKEYGFLSLDEVSPRSPLVKMLVAIRNSQLVAVT